MKLFGLLLLLITLLGGTSFFVYEDTATTERVSGTEQQTDATPNTPSVLKETDTHTADERVEIYTGISTPITTTKLDISNRQLTGSLKAEVRHLTALTELTISNNEFTGLPAEVGQLTELRILNLSNNPITGLPHELGNLQKLTLLDLRNTQYSKADLARIAAQLPSTTKILTE